MKKIFKYIMFLTIGALAVSCAYDESELGGQLDNIKNRIEELKADIETVNTQLAALNEIANGNPVTAVTQDTDGKYVITYKDRNNEEKTVVLATMDQMVKVPMVGVKVDEESGMNCWTLDGEFMVKDGQKVPVSGFAPNVSVDAEGYWTIDGERIKDFNGNDVYAHDGESCLFKSITTDADGDLVITQGNGNVITIPVQGAINLTLSAGVNTTVINANQAMTITYDVVGVNAADAMVAIADAQGVAATMDREAKTISVGFPASFTSGYLLVVAYDLEEHTVLRPVFFSTPGGEGGSDEPLDYVAIYNAQQLVQFASDVNAGTGMESMDAKLMNDIDMTGITSWTPVGNCVSTWADNTLTITGTPYKAHFDGQGFTLKNFNMTCNNSTAGKAYGMFGVISDGAVVENFKFDSSCSITASPTAQTDCGLVAGVVNASTVKNITSSAALTYDGNSSAPDAVRMTLGMVGFAFATNTDVTIENLVNKGAIVSKNSGHNTKNGAACIQVAGILGFGTNGVENSVDMTGYVNVVNCTNDGNMTSDAARTAGIVAAANRFTFIDGCTNNGNQTNSHAVSMGGRLGNITCITGAGSKLRNCTNNGDLISSTSARIGGVVGFVNHKTNTFENCHNTGDIISDWDAGLFFGYDNVAATFTNCSVAGSTGTYNSGSYSMNTVTSTNYITNKYVGNIGTSAASYVTTSTIRYVGENAVGIKSAADLEEFASLVNAGSSYAKFQDENGTVNLLKDIDMSSVSSWTPIGYATVPAGDGNDKAITGNAFTGHFAGNGFKIKNLKMTSSGSTAGQNYGLFGTLGAGAVVENFIIDETCSLEVTATARIASGVVAGFVFDATVRDVTSYAPMTFNGKVASDFMSIAMIGQVYCDQNGVIIDSCHNHGEIVANNTTNTNQSGAQAYHAAGIVGFAHAQLNSEKINTISFCSNSGNMTSALARTSGIVGAANRNTEISNCDNTGDQINSYPTSGGSRLGNITCVATNSCTVAGCTNYGDLISTTSGRIGGIVSLPNSATFSNCANYGEILTDQANGYRGVFFSFNGDGNSSTWKNCTAGGKVGTYNSNSPVYDEYTEAEKENYLGKFNSGQSQTYDNITYLIGTTEPVVGGTADYNILFIGNSFTMDAVWHLPGLLDGAGNKRVRCTLMYYGGRTISEYYNGWTTTADYKHYEAAAGSTEFSLLSGTSAYTSLPEAVAACEWDVITFQEHTGRTAAWTWTSTAQSQIQGLIDYAKTAYPSSSTKTPKFYYIMSQAYKDMTLAQGDPTWTQLEMYDAIVAYGENAVQNCSFDGVIATGTMLQNLRTSSINNSMDMTRDGYHMDNGIARYGAACTVFETLITPVFGVNLDGNSFRYNVSNTSTSAYTTPVTSENAPIALQAARYAIQKPYEITDMGGSSSEPETGTEVGGIDTAAEYLAFLQAVNAGTSLSEYMNASGEVLLKENIDLSTITNAQWQAIADGTSVSNANNDCTIAAGAFTGTFNGNSKKITGFNPTVSLAGGKTFGLLPILNGATVKDLQISGAMKLSATGAADAGMLCGTAFNSTVQNVTVSGTINSTGTTATVRFSLGGLAGFACAKDSKNTVFSSCTSSVAVTAVGGSNTANGATGAMYGGIIGFATTPKNITSRVKVTSCINNGNMNVTLGRCSGIVATANCGVEMSSCTNNGDQVNAIANGRIANICCNISLDCSAKNCVNNGDIEATAASYGGTVGGMFALCGDDSVVIEGGGNYGTVKVPSTATYKGLLSAQITKCTSVKNVTISGKMYVGGTLQSITASNYMDYVGTIAASYSSKVTGLTYVAPTN